jgi:hypothetical protein
LAKFRAKNKTLRFFSVPSFQHPVE